MSTARRSRPRQLLHSSPPASIATTADHGDVVVAPTAAHEPAAVLSALPDAQLSALALTGGGPFAELAARILRDRSAGDEGRLIAYGLGDLAIVAETLTISRRLGGTSLMREAVRARMGELRAELEGPRPTALEGILARRIVLCWLEVHLADLEAASPAVGQSERFAEHKARMRDRAEARLLRACKALATVRRIDVANVLIDARVVMPPGPG